MEPSVSLLLVISPLCRHSVYCIDNGQGGHEVNGPIIDDKLEALSSMYLERAYIDDKEETERWKNECDVLLVFVGALINLLSFRMQLHVNAE